MDTATQKKLLAILTKYIGLLLKPFNDNNYENMAKAMSFIRIDICKTYVFGTAKTTYTIISGLIEHMMVTGYFRTGTANELIPLLRDLSDIYYQVCNLTAIPKDVSIKISPDILSSEDKFEKVLDSYCTYAIAERLQQHVSSFKNQKHHRAPLIAFLTQVHDADSNWYQNPKIIQGELIKFRGNLLIKNQRNTAYSQFQHVKNAFSVLIQQGLLPNDTVLPNNLRRLH